MFPSVLADQRLASKSYVFALRHGGFEKAWPLARFAEEPVVNDRLGDIAVVLIGEPASRSVRAFRRDERRVRAEAGRLIAGDATFELTEDALIGTDGSRFGRLPGHIAYWFAWQSFLPDGEVAIPR